MSPLWSYLLTVVGVFGLWLVGRKDKRGFMVGIAAQVLWISYATFTAQWGFYVSALAYGWINVKNLRAWRAADKRRSVMRGMKVPADLWDRTLAGDPTAVKVAIKVLERRARVLGL